MKFYIVGENLKLDHNVPLPSHGDPFEPVSYDYTKMFQWSVEFFPGETLLGIHPGWFKLIPNGVEVKKLNVNRGMYVSNVPVWGKPKLKIANVRDRWGEGFITYTMISDWASMFEVKHTPRFIDEKTVMDIITVLGRSGKIGDSYRITTEDDPDFQRITEQGRAEQIKGMLHPEPFDRETENLIRWMEEINYKHSSIIFPQRKIA